MKTIIAGSRGVTWEEFVVEWNRIPKDVRRAITEVVSGGAKGPDLHGEAIARRCRAPIKRFIPEWGVHGKKAGMLRNAQMALYADQLIVFWDGESKGTKHMIDCMNKLGKYVYVMGFDYD